MKDNDGQVIGFEKLNYTIPSTSNLKISFETATVQPLQQSFAIALMPIENRHDPVASCYQSEHGVSQPGFALRTHAKLKPIGW
jgi:hypothetical protein